MLLGALYLVTTLTYKTYVDLKEPKPGYRMTPWGKSMAVVAEDPEMALRTHIVSSLQQFITPVSSSDLHGPCTYVVQICKQNTHKKKEQPYDTDPLNQA